MAVSYTHLDVYKRQVVVNSDASANFVTEGEKIEVVGSVYINAALEELEKELTPEELASVKLEITEAAVGVEFKVPSGITVKNLTAVSYTHLYKEGLKRKETLSCKQS